MDFVVTDTSGVVEVGMTTVTRGIQVGLQPAAPDAGHTAYLAPSRSNWLHKGGHIVS